MANGKTDNYVPSKSDLQEQRNNDVEGKLNNTASSSYDSSSSSSSESEHSFPRALDGGWGWMVVTASFIAHLIADGCGFSVGVLFAEWLDVFQESKAKTAFVSSLFVSMPAICGPFASIVTNKFGCRRTTIAGGCIAACGCIISFFANSIDVLCVTFGVIAGFGLALVYVPAVVVVAFYFEKRRAFATGIAVAGSGIGTFIFAPLTEFLIDTYSWRGALIIIGGIMLNLAVCGALFRPLVEVELRKKQFRYLRSVEKFSRASSRRQSREAIDRRLEVNETENNANCNANGKELISHSLVLLPTYVTSLSDLVPDLYDINKQGRQNSKSFTDLTLERGWEKEVSFGCVKNVESLDMKNTDANEAKLSVKNLDTAEKIEQRKRNVASKRKKIHFPEHLMPRSHVDIFYRGSLLKAGFLLSRGQSASCPDIFVHDQKRHSLRSRLQSFKLRHVFNMIRDTTDFSIFRNQMFLFFCVHSMLLYVSYDIPYVYIHSKALDFGISEKWASFLVSIVGIVSTFGQVFMGYVGDRTWINRLYFYIAMITIAGLATLVVPALTSYAFLATYCGVFGFFISANFALTTIIVVELLGMDQLTNAYGFISLAEGLANLVGPPAAGWIIDKSGSYDLAFYLAGVVICISGLMLLIVPCRRKCRSFVGKKSYNTDSLELSEDNHINKEASAEELESLP